MKTHNFELKLTFAVFIAVFVIGCNSKQTDNQDMSSLRVATDSMSIFQTDSLLSESENSRLDSLLRVAATAKQDTNLALVYYTIGEIYYNFDYEKAKTYYLKLKNLSEKLGWNEGLYRYATASAGIYNREGLIDSSLIVTQQAHELAKKEMDEEWIAITSVNMGLGYAYKRWFETALNYYNEALPILEKRGDKFRLAHIYYLMGVIYGYMNMYDEEIAYSEKSLDILKERPDTLIRAYTLTNYAFALYKSPKRQIEKAENCLIEAQRISNLYNNKYLLMGICGNLWQIALNKYDLNKAEIYALKASELASEFGDVESHCASNIGLGYIEWYKGNYDKAEEHAREALKTAIENELPDDERDCYTLLSNVSISRRNFRNQILFTAKSDSVQNALVSENTRGYAKEMQVKYETEKKELQITALEKEKRLMTGLSIAGSVVLLLALTTIFSLWRWTVQKRRIAEKQKQLAEQQIIQLEQEKQIIAAQSVLDGETQERTRLARDLHDGLGSMLTGVQMGLQDMKKGAVLEYEDVERLNRALKLLDQSVQEMRRVAHHLMPDSLSRFGLKPAVSDFCRNMPTVKFAYYGDESRLEQNFEVMIYRTIHELVNNALKHSSAEHIIVQIIQEQDRIAFTVQDDGCGFDPEADAQGMGLQNIRDRITTFNGMMNIDSKIGEGTEINVELKI
ncbi:MAG: sensor histidine kinase [Paludibacter sp.]|nr:sensor histidine kinase [Paludibacter sp.]